ncbi:protein of unknown function [Taphrina deformans PYCC 5710]|uniref:40S ribosomal protein S25 n=1 Tax=Taphrina deformans (strain PYCC 5710 / ATCC 11124 / CBS 356.35 / IMI 108563 / JCM 9778 / NBRC 8474) TaxID=1097556 RepID=R4XF53_TAPDE|nr:protein of unknown function [Taphrina deformans PYCC 5710]|eukprot:CCG84406.1 protein of unknown function [Taphrina deformans PYCC 5710]
MAVKKKWSKGKVKDKANNAIMLDKNQYDKLFKEVGSYRFVSVSVLVDRLKINGSLARRALVELAEKGIIKEVELSHSQKIYTRALETEA